MNTFTQYMNQLDGTQRYLNHLRRSAGMPAKKTGVELDELPPRVRAQVHRQMAEQEEQIANTADGVNGSALSTRSDWKRIVGLTLCYGLLVTGKAMQSIGRAFEDGARHLLNRMES